jgi:hypothetical protein
MKSIILILSVFILSSCAVNQVLTEKSVYMHDMKIEVNGHKGVGTLVVPMSSLISVKVRAKGKLDLFVWSTCARNISAEAAFDEGMFSSKYETSFEYRPSVLERTDCAVQLEGYEKIKGRHSWAFIDFEDGTSTLPATITCNGQTYTSKGVTVCQSKKGIRQQVTFAAPVLVGAQDGCPLPFTEDEKTFYVEIGKGACRYNFLEKEGERNHRITTIGYDEVLLRED